MTTLIKWNKINIQSRIKFSSPQEPVLRLEFTRYHVHNWLIFYILSVLKKKKTLSRIWMYSLWDIVCAICELFDVHLLLFAITLMVRMATLLLPALFRVIQMICVFLWTSTVIWDCPGMSSSISNIPSSGRNKW